MPTAGSLVRPVRATQVQAGRARQCACGAGEGGQGHGRCNPHHRGLAADASCSPRRSAVSLAPVRASPLLQPSYRPGNTQAAATVSDFSWGRRRSVYKCLPSDRFSCRQHACVQHRGNSMPRARVDPSPPLPSPLLGAQDITTAACRQLAVQVNNKRTPTGQFYTTVNPSLHEKQAPPA